MITTYFLTKEKTKQDIKIKRQKQRIDKYARLLLTKK